MINRKIDVDIWKDKKMRKDISNLRVRYFWLFLLTCPLSTTCGIFKITFDEMSFYTDLDIDECKQYLMTLHDLNLIEYNTETEEIAIFNYPKYNIYGWTDQVSMLLTKELTAVHDQNLIRLMCKTMQRFIDTHQKEKFKCELIYRIMKLYETSLEEREPKKEKQKEIMPSWEEMITELGEGDRKNEL